MPELYRVEREGSLFVLTRPNNTHRAKDLPNLLMAVYSVVPRESPERSLIYADAPTHNPGPHSLTSNEYDYFSITHPRFVKLTG